MTASQLSAVLCTRAAWVNTRTVPLIGVRSGVLLRLWMRGVALCAGAAMFLAPGLALVPTLDLNLLPDGRVILRPNEWVVPPVGRSENLQ